MDDYEELVIELKDIQEGDQVLGSDNEWHDIELQPIHIPEKMFRIEFKVICEKTSNEFFRDFIGYVECSGDHQWTIFGNASPVPVVLSANDIHDMFKGNQKSIIDGCTVGLPLNDDKNVYINDIIEIEPKEVRCLHILHSRDDNQLFGILVKPIDKDKNDKGFLNHVKQFLKICKDQFKEIKFNENEYVNEMTIFTHNCMQRLVCGQLGSIASRMALDDQSATTIDGTHKGAGLIKAQGQKSHIQYYYADPEWIEEWYRKRGLDKKGYGPEDKEANEVAENIDFGEDEEITIDENKVTMEFNDIKKEIDFTKDQEFEEL